MRSTGAATTAAPVLNDTASGNRTTLLANALRQEAWRSSGSETGGSSAP